MVKEQNEFLTHLALLILFAQENRFVVTGGELWRTKEQQQVYVLSGKSQTMNSMHLMRLAMDLNFFLEREGIRSLTYDKAHIQPIGDYWESMHEDNKWGGNWEKFLDTGHFERTL